MRSRKLKGVNKARNTIDDLKEKLDKVSPTERVAIERKLFDKEEQRAKALKAHAEFDKTIRDHELVCNCGNTKRKCDIKIPVPGSASAPMDTTSSK